jgi:hypothetical protein
MSVAIPPHAGLNAAGEATNPMPTVHRAAVDRIDRGAPPGRKAGLHAAPWLARP